MLELRYSLSQTLSVLRQQFVNEMSTQLVSTQDGLQQQNIVAAMLRHDSSDAINIQTYHGQVLVLLGLPSSPPSSSSSYCRSIIVKCCNLWFVWWFTLHLGLQHPAATAEEKGPLLWRQWGKKSENWFQASSDWLMITWLNSQRWLDEAFHQSGIGVRFKFYLLSNLINNTTGSSRCTCIESMRS